MKHSANGPAGREHARRPVGRPHVKPTADEVLQLRSEGAGTREIARRLGIGAATASRLLSGSSSTQDAFQNGVTPFQNSQRSASHAKGHPTPASPPQAAIGPEKPDSTPATQDALPDRAEVGPSCAASDSPVERLQGGTSPLLSRRRPPSRLGNQPEPSGVPGPCPLCGGRIWRLMASGPVCVGCAPLNEDTAGLM